jgi:hypothetical protein
MSSGWRVGLALVVGLCLALVFNSLYCGSKNGLNLGRVRGKVTYMGEPVRWGNILFVPDNTKGTGGPAAIGVISLEGTYNMASEDADDGAMVGFHKVGILGLDPVPLNGEPSPSENSAFASKVARARELRARSRIRTRPKAKEGEGESKRTKTFFDGRTYEIVVPDKVLSPETSGISVEVKRGTNTIDFDIKEDGAAEITRR